MQFSSVLSAERRYVLWLQRTSAFGKPSGWQEPCDLLPQANATFNCKLYQAVGQTLPG